MKLYPVAKKGEETSVEGVKKSIFKGAIYGLFQRLRTHTEPSCMLIKPAQDEAVLGHQVARHFYNLSDMSLVLLAF